MPPVARAFTALISLAFTRCELLTSPTKNPIDTLALVPLPFTLLSEMVAR